MQFRTQAFPFCPVESEDIGPGTLHPVGVSAQIAADWYWRVKFWTVELVMSWGTYTFVDKQFTNIFLTPETERDLICNDLAGWDFRDSVIESVPTTIVSFDMFLFASSGVPQTGGGINVAAAPPDVPFETDAARKSGATIYPMMLFRMGADRSTVTTSEEDVTTFSGSGNSPSTTIFTIQDTLVQVYSVSEAHISAVSVQPQEWWPYAPASAPSRPIWDTSNGNEIRSNTVSD